MLKIKKGDLVEVITGKDKGKSGAVTKVLDAGVKVLIDGINIYKKNVKANPREGVKGGIESISKPLDRSNVAILNHQNKKDKVKIEILDGVKRRVFKSNGEAVDVS